jgi:hypothetical protein
VIANVFYMPTCLCLLSSAAMTVHEPPVISRNPISKINTRRPPLYMANRFEYDVLDGWGCVIRLCKILPGSRTDDQVCVLSTHKLSAPDCPSYEALSYVWGSPEPSYQLRCVCETSSDDTSTSTEVSLTSLSTFLDIGPNLRSALLRLRNKAYARIFWIDAICINQENITERGQQVGIMGEIYRRAVSVLIWLGEENEETVPALRCLLLLYSWRDGHMSRRVSIDERFDDERPWSVFYGAVGDMSAKFWNAFENLLLREWFDRGWVFQEAVLAQELFVAVGRFCFEWEVLVSACKFVESNEDTADARRRIAGVNFHYRVLDIEKVRTGIFYIRLRINQGEEDLPKSLNTVFSDSIKKLSLASLLTTRRRSITKDPRDKVYSLLGIRPGLKIKESKHTTREEARKLIPDYGMTVRDLFSMVARYLFFELGETECFKIFSWVHNTIESNNLPSWVPDWSCKLETVPLTSLGGCFNQFDASKNCPSKSVLWFEENICKIRICGVPLMHIKALGSEFTRSQIHASFHADEAARMLNDLPQNYPTLNITYEIAYSLAITCKNHNSIFGELGSSSKKRKRPQPQPAPPGFWEFTKSCEDRHEALAPPYGRKLDSFQSDLTSALISGWRLPRTHRRFFISEFGFIGLAPAKAEPGDVVCILFGAKVPYAIRKMGQFWRFIGECFVLGVMEGEAGVNLEEDRIQDFIFE